jgi:sulfite reductase (NADPH) flavoprotein alpha-component
MTRGTARATAHETLGHVLALLPLLALAAWFFALHAGAMQWRDPGPARCWTAAATFTAWLMLIALRYRRRANRQRDESDGATVLIACASQTGFASQLASRTADQLDAAGMPSRVVELGSLDDEALRAAGRVLFVVSTTGEGDAPDSAAAFERRCLSRAIALPELRYGLLALGDRDYASFCGFGRRLRHWLTQSGAQPLFDAVEVDDGDAGALRHWQHHLSLLSGAGEMPDWHRAPYRRWRLVERRLLNPGSVGAPCFHLALRPIEGELAWEAGDIAEIEPRHAADDVARWLAATGFDGTAPIAGTAPGETLADRLARSHLPPVADVVGWDVARLGAALSPLPHREYSIASVPADGALHLLVRQMRRDDGRLGLGSGWLTRDAADGAQVALRVRANPSFRPPAPERPLILIGNGTGLAGLRALLKARITSGARRQWLLFGERQVRHDFFHREEIERWQRGGWLERLDLAWSRDASPAYVQQRLREAATELQAWIAQDAAICVCGSLAGMAPGVDEVLREVLGAATVERLREEGRYRRDVY